MLVKLAGFSAIRTIEEFDFKFAVGVPKKQITGGNSGRYPFSSLRFLPLRYCVSIQSIAWLREREATAESQPVPVVAYQ